MGLLTAGPGSQGDLKTQPRPLVIQQFCRGSGFGLVESGGRAVNKQAVVLGGKAHGEAMMFAAQDSPPDLLKTHRPSPRVVKGPRASHRALAMLPSVALGDAQAVSSGA